LSRFSPSRLFTAFFGHITSRLFRLHSSSLSCGLWSCYTERLLRCPFCRQFVICLPADLTNRSSPPRAGPMFSSMSIYYPLFAGMRGLARGGSAWCR
jgi:hypothetical protein